ncbi:4691_t:CDS:2 [Entrophospora sp. SA101]|nr:4691_t:CDS:2 [Entrophospora sp. SA101]
MNPLLLQSHDKQLIEQPTQILEYSTLHYIDPRSLDLYQTSQTFTDPLSSHIDVHIQDHINTRQFESSVLMETKRIVYLIKEEKEVENLVARTNKSFSILSSSIRQPQRYLNS